MNRVFSYIIFSFLLACSTLSQNNVEQESIRFVGGVYKNERWNDSLTFERVSWYHGLTLYYDALMYQVDTDSNFFKWFSESEKKYADECHPLLVTVLYSADPKKISHAQFRAEMENNGFVTVPILNFARSVKAHPHYSAWNLQKYRVLGFCRSLVAFKQQQEIFINFPSFFQAKIEL